MRGLPSSKPFSSGFKSPSLTGRGFGNPLAGRAPTLKKEGGTKVNIRGNCYFLDLLNR